MSKRQVSISFVDVPLMSWILYHKNPKLFGMIQAEEIDSLPILPRELERVIFETAAENRLMAVRLLLVAKRVKQWYVVLEREESNSHYLL